MLFKGIRKIHEGKSITRYDVDATSRNSVLVIPVPLC